jgi:long-chain acyl-CoA synthetase
MKEMIIRGGFNVHPREIEEVIYEHPNVAEAALVRLPHDELGEEVGAAVVLKPGSRRHRGRHKAFVKARGAAYKYPRHVWLEDSLPKGPTGKVLRREIKATSSSAATRWNSGSSLCGQNTNECLIAM